MTFQVLVVEDEAIIALAIEEALAEAGFTSHSAGSYAEALDAFSGEPQAFRSAIVDIGLPDGRGDDLCRKFRALRADLPIVLCTGYEYQDIRTEAFAEHGVVVVQKPCPVSAIVEGLRAAEGQA